MKFVLPSIHSDKTNIEAIKLALSTLTFMSILKVFLILVSVSLAALFVALTILIYPALSVVVIGPIFLAAFWLFPQTSGTPPTGTIKGLFFVWLVLSILWPAYVVLEIPGVFDIWPVRLIMMVLVLYGVFYLIKSTQLKSYLLTIYHQHSLPFNLLFLYLAFLCLGTFSKGLLDGAPYMFFRQVSEVFIPLFIFMVLADSKEKLLVVLDVLIFVAGIVVVLALIESIFEAGIYISILPSSMISQQDWVQLAISEKVRGEYRVQSVFEHPLTLGQFLVLFFSLFIYKFVTGKTKLTRYTSLLLVPILLYILYKTGSRSVYVGVFVQVLFFGIMAMYFIIKEKKATFIGWVFTVLSPIFFLLVMVVAFFLRDLIFGRTNSEASSTQARIDMFMQTFTIFGNDPVAILTGYGAGAAATVLGFRSPVGILTIDSYVLNVLLDSGIIGLTCFVLFFVVIFFIGLRLLAKSKSDKWIVMALMSGIIGYLSVALILSVAVNLKLVFLFAFSLILLSSFMKNTNKI